MSLRQVFRDAFGGAPDPASYLLAESTPQAIVVSETSPAPEAQPQAGGAFQPTLSVGNGSIYEAGTVLGALGTGYAHLAECSERLFSDNLYARGILKRFITSVINTGLLVEATPNSDVVGVAQERLDVWTEAVETAFELWGGRAELCSYKGDKTLSEQETEAYSLALRQGDALVIESQDKRTGLPVQQVIPGRRIVSPIEALESGRRVVDGIELDAEGREIAYWVADHLPDTFLPVRMHDMGRIRSVPARDSTGRRIAWRVFSSPQRIGVRGEPLLALLIRGLSEIDKYRESVQRKALLTSLVAFVVTKKEEGPGTNPLSNLGGGLTRTGAADDDATVTDRNLKVGTYVPGAMIDEMAPGEDLKALGHEGTDIRFAEFQDAIVDVISWSQGVPPEVLVMRYSNNYSASQASNSKWNLTVDMIREDLGRQYVRPTYESFLLSASLVRYVEDLGFLATRRDPRRWMEHASWVSCEVVGPADPLVDPVKQVNALEKAFEMCLVTKRTAARQYGGGKFSRIVKERAREDAMIREAKLIAVNQTHTLGEDPPDPEPPGGNLRDGEDGATPGGDDGDSAA